MIANETVCAVSGTEPVMWVREESYDLHEHYVVKYMDSKGYIMSMLRENNLK